MGASGTAIFSDDLAADIRAEFKDFVGRGLSPEEATHALEKDYADSLEDEDDAPVFWIALAVTQHRLGRLLPRVLEKALAAIDGGEDLRRWEEDSKLKARRAAVLASARVEILSPQPEAKRIPKPFRDENAWPVGQAVAYRLAPDTFCAFHVLGHHEDLGGRSPVVRVFEWMGQTLPREADLIVAGYREPSAPGDSSHTMIGATSKREFPKDRLTILPFAITTMETPAGYAVTLWRWLDEYLEATFALN